MPKSRLYLLYIAVGIFVAFYLYKRYRTVPATPLTEIQVLDSAGNTVVLPTEAGKPVVINYFASWCGPCMREIPELNRFYAAHQNEVNFVGLTDDPMEKMKQTVNSTGISYPVYKLSASLSTAGVHSIPFTVFYDAAGNQVGDRNGMVDEAFLKAQLEQLK